jgi:hypothetical protein
VAENERGADVQACGLTTHVSENDAVVHYWACTAAPTVSGFLPVLIFFGVRCLHQQRCSIKLLNHRI